MSLAVAAEETKTAVEDIFASFTSGRTPGVVVDSPPGAGKSALVTSTANRLAVSREIVAIVAQTNSQVDDLVDRLARGAPQLIIGRLAAHDYRPTAWVAHANVVIRRSINDLADAHVVAGTAAKWKTLPDGRWPWAIIDEAYQMRSDTLLQIANRFERMLFVGDPGQLDPFSTVDIDRWAGLTWDPMQSAVAAMLRHGHDIPLHRLPRSWRLPPSAAHVIAEAFYPFTGFTAATGPQDRQLVVPVRPWRASPLDEVIQTAADTGWALLELPPRNTVRTDAEAVEAVTAAAVRVLQRGAESYSEQRPNGTRITADRIAVGAAHRDQVAALQAAVAAAGGQGIRVDTANRLQGGEYDVTVVLHPLSGRRDATAFHLESGRLCVLTTRHRHACIVVARAGIPELLDAHPSAEPMHLNAPVKFPDGWEANQAVLAHLANHRIRAA